MQEMLIRKLEKADYGKGFLETLANLEPTPLGRNDFLKVFNLVERARCISIFVVEIGGEVVGAATLLVEPKFIHNGGLVGYIEDVAVKQEFKKQGVLDALIKHVKEQAEKQGCYMIKVI